MAPTPVTPEPGAGKLPNVESGLYEPSEETKDKTLFYHTRTRGVFAAAKITSGLGILDTGCEGTAVCGRRVFTELTHQMRRAGRKGPIGIQTNNTIYRFGAGSGRVEATYLIPYGEARDNQTSDWFTVDVVPGALPLLLGTEFMSQFGLFPVPHLGKVFSMRDDGTMREVRSMTYGRLQCLELVPSMAMGSTKRLRGLEQQFQEARKEETQEPEFGRLSEADVEKFQVYCGKRRGGQGDGKSPRKAGWDPAEALGGTPAGKADGSVQEEVISTGSDTGTERSVPEVEEREVGLEPAAVGSKEERVQDAERKRRKGLRKKHQRVFELKDAELVKLHMDGHATAERLYEFLRRTIPRGYWKRYKPELAKLKARLRIVVKDCGGCARHGKVRRPGARVTEEVQANDVVIGDLACLDYDQNVWGLACVDKATNMPMFEIVDTRSAADVAYQFELRWVKRRGPPRAFFMSDLGG